MSGTQKTLGSELKLYILPKSSLNQGRFKYPENMNTERLLLLKVY